MIIIQLLFCSVKKAMQTYARQGTFLPPSKSPSRNPSNGSFGASAILFAMTVCISLRIVFDAYYNIGCVARPGHPSAPGGFERARKFKIASK